MTVVLNPLAFTSQASLALSSIAEELSFSLSYLVVRVINVWCIWSSERLSYFRVILERSFFCFSKRLFVGQLSLLPVRPCCVWVTWVSRHHPCGGHGVWGWPMALLIWFPRVRSHGCISALLLAPPRSREGARFWAPMLLLPLSPPGAGPQLLYLYISWAAGWLSPGGKPSLQALSLFFPRSRLPCKLMCESHGCARVWSRETDV